MFKKFMRYCSLVIIISLVLSSFSFPVMAQSAPSIVVNIPDHNLENAIRVKIGKLSGAIYSTDMAKLVNLTSFNCGIKDLSGLQYAVNLQDLRLDDNEISSLEPLSNLKKLSILCVQNNKLTSLEPLKNVTSITNINAVMNNISDLMPLTNLVKLTDLTLDCNPIKELPPQMSNLKALNVLWMSNTLVTDLTPLKTLHNIHMLLLNCNGITDISPLKGFQLLENLQLAFNNVTDLTPLEGLENLHWLDLTYNKITDCSPIGKIKNLRTLILKDNNISDISSLSSLSKICFLNLSGNNVGQDGLATIAKLKTLEYANLEATLISDLSLLRHNSFLLPNLACNLGSYTTGMGGIEAVTPKVFDPNSMAVESKIHHIISTIITPDMTELEKTLSLYDYVSKNAKYSSDSVAEASAYSLLIRGNAICSTYCNTIDDLFSAAGLDSRSIGGAGHAWNIASIGGKFYHLDATWGYGYFLLSDDAIRAKRSGPEFDWTDITSALRWYKDVPCDSDLFVSLNQFLQQYSNTKNQFVIKGDFVYYIDNASNMLKKVSIDGGEPITLVSDHCHAIYYNNDNLIYLDDTDKQYYSINEDGTGKTLVDWLFVIATMPSQCANVFPLSNTIAISYNTNISLNDGTQIKLTDTMGRVVPAKISVTGNTLSIKPQKKLLGYEEYSLTVPAVAISGDDDIAMKTDYNLYFSTAKDSNEIPKPKVSLPQGIYTSDISASILGNSGDIIYYSVDGTCPTVNSSIYLNPINISKNTVLRYFAVDLSGNQSKVYTQVYVISKTYTVIFNSNGGTTIPNKIAFNNNTILAPTPPTRTGYVFKGWYKDSLCTTPWDFASDTVTAGITLFAKWVTPIPASVKAASSSYNSITISWAAVPNAKGYEMWYATSSNGTYTLAGSTTEATLTKTELTTGRFYYFKVRSYTLSGLTKVSGDFSTVVSSRPVPAAPTSVKAACASAISIKITWGAVSGATKYEIYRSTSASAGYVRVYTTAYTNFTNIGLITGKTYYYKVIAYHLEGTAKVYSRYSVSAYAKP